MKEKDIKLLIEKFFAGETSLSEERKLYIYFKRGNVSDSLKQYSPMFADLFLLQEPAEKSPRRNFIRWIAGVAASVVLLSGGYMAWTSFETQELYASYGGSYMIVNGKRIDNLREIKPYIENTLSDARYIERTAAAQPSVSDIERDLMDNISDPEELERVKQLLN